MSTSQLTTGNWGEELAARHLVHEGYHLLERNWHAGHYEVDIIAERFGLLVFVEVKTRTHSSDEEAAEAVDHEKQGFLLAAARNYLGRQDMDNLVRFDIITITGDAPPYHVVQTLDAFSADSYARVEMLRKHKPRL